MKEIITLQFGTNANFAGAHFWNLQERQFDYTSESIASNAIFHDVLFREGRNSKNETTYTPRLLCYEGEGALRGISKESPLYQAEDAQITTWQREVQRIEQEAAPSEYHQALEKNEDLSIQDSKHWSDYMRLYLHPRSLHSVPGIGTDVDTAFLSFWDGRERWDDQHVMSHEFEEDFRQYMEECDFCQGVQVLTDIDNGFAGFCSGALEHIQDEYSGKRIMTFGIHSAGARYYQELDEPISEHDVPFAQLEVRRKQTELRKQASMTIACALNDIRMQSTCFVPLSTSSSLAQPYKQHKATGLTFDGHNRFETGAVLASLIDSVTSSCRIKGDNDDLSQLAISLSSDNKLAFVSGVVPLPNRPLSSSLHQWKHLLNDSPVQLWAPTAQSDVMPRCAWITVRGTDRLTLTPSRDELQKQKHVSKYDVCSSAEDMLLRFMGETQSASSFVVRSVAKGLPLASPFPKHMFGDVSAKESSFSTLTAAHTGDYVNNLFDDAKLFVQQWTTSQTATREDFQFHCEMREIAENIERLVNEATSY